MKKVVIVGAGPAVSRARCAMEVTVWISADTDSSQRTLRFVTGGKK